LNFKFNLFNSTLLRLLLKEKKPKYTFILNIQFYVLNSIIKVTICNNCLFKIFVKKLGLTSLLFIIHNYNYYKYTLAE